MTSWDAPTPPRQRTLDDLLNDLDRACEDMERATRELAELSPFGDVLLSVMEKPSRGAPTAREARPGSDERSLNGYQDEANDAA